MGFLSRLKRQKRQNVVRKSRLRESLESLAFTIVFVWLFTNHIAQATEVPTESMQPTILPGDHFFLDKVAFPANYPESLQKYLPARTIHRGEIQDFWSPATMQMGSSKQLNDLPDETAGLPRHPGPIDRKQAKQPYT